MALQTIGQLSSTQWLGTLSVFNESRGNLQAFSIEHPRSEGEQQNTTKEKGQISEKSLEKGSNSSFIVFPGDSKNSENMQRPSAATSLESPFCLPLVSAKNPSIDQCCGMFSTYSHQISSRIMLPWSLATEDGPIYVNAKQYKRIIKRRQTRAKAVMTRVRKPYLHKSRHLHATRRARGSGGRFLNKKDSKNEETKTETKKHEIAILSRSGSLSSTVVQSDSGTLNSSKDINGSGSNLSGSEVTSLYSRGDSDFFTVNHLEPSLHPLSEFRHGIVMPTKWIFAADRCCNLGI